MKFKKLFAIALLATSTNVNAFDGWLDIHLQSFHEESTYQFNNEAGTFNEENFGLGISLPVTSNIDTRAGFFENSFNKTSIYAGTNIHTNSKPLFSFNNNPVINYSLGFNVGVVSGYENTINGDTLITPMLAPTLTLSGKHIKAEIGYIPALKAEHVNVLTFSVGTRF